LTLDRATALPRFLGVAGCGCGCAGSHGRRTGAVHCIVNSHKHGQIGALFGGAALPKTQDHSLTREYIFGPHYCTVYANSMRHSSCIHVQYIADFDLLEPTVIAIVGAVPISVPRFTAPIMTRSLVTRMRFMPRRDQFSTTPERSRKYYRSVGRRYGDDLGHETKSDTFA